MMEDTLRVLAIDRHNAKRALHQAPPLKYSLKIEAQAQKWADRLIATGSFEHSRSEYGENLMMGGCSASLPVDKARVIGQAIEMFYSEIKEYKEPKFTMATGHFTQLVWKGTKQLGVGIASGNGKVVVVFNYSPPGNMMGQFKANVQMVPIVSKGLVINEECVLDDVVLL